MSEATADSYLAERLEHAVDALVRGDTDAFIDMLSPDVVWEVRALGLSLAGPVAIRKFAEEWFLSYEEHTIEVAESCVLGGGVTLIVLQQTGRLKGSSSEVHQRIAHVYTWVDGLIVRIDGYQDIGEAHAVAERLAEERGQAVSRESTPPDLEEKLRRAFEAYSRRDFGGAIAVFSPGGVWDMSQLGMGVFEGHDGIQRFAEDWIGSYEDYEQEVEEFRDLGNGVTFGVFMQHGRPAGSSGSVGFRYAGVVVWASGLIEHFTTYTDIDEARAAAELLAQDRR